MSGRHGHDFGNRVAVWRGARAGHASACAGDAGRRRGGARAAPVADAAKRRPGVGAQGRKRQLPPGTCCYVTVGQSDRGRRPPSIGCGRERVECEQRDRGSRPVRTADVLPALHQARPRLAFSSPSLLCKAAVHPPQLTAPRSPSESTPLYISSISSPSLSPILLQSLHFPRARLSRHLSSVSHLLSTPRPLVPLL